jgi:hypothetical protein
VCGGLLWCLLQEGEGRRWGLEGGGSFPFPFVQAGTLEIRHKDRAHAHQQMERVLSTTVLVLSFNSPPLPFLWSSFVLAGRLSPGRASELSPTRTSGNGLTYRLCRHGRSEQRGSCLCGVVCVGVGIKVSVKRPKGRRHRIDFAAMNEGLGHGTTAAFQPPQGWPRRPRSSSEHTWYPVAAVVDASPVLVMELPFPFTPATATRPTPPPTRACKGGERGRACRVS